MRDLLEIDFTIIFMDITLLVMEYQNRHVFEQAIKEVVCSFKLQLEFVILGKLVSITQPSGGAGGSMSLEPDHHMGTRNFSVPSNAIERQSFPSRMELELTKSRSVDHGQHIEEARW